jgi:hypothetical protein
MCGILKSVFEYIATNKQVNEVVSLKILQDITDTIEDVITKQPLSIIYQALE